MNKRQSKKRKKSLDIDPHDLDMSKLFRDLIRERSLYAVLKNLADECKWRADSYAKKPADEVHEVTTRMWADESQFFEDAAARIVTVLAGLRSSWKGREPMSADGDLRRAMGIYTSTSLGYYRETIATLADLMRNPEVDIEEKLSAASVFAKEAAGITWTNRQTGRPDFKISDNFHQLTVRLADPNTPEPDRAEILAFIVEFVNR